MKVRGSILFFFIAFILMFNPLLSPATEENPKSNIEINALAAEWSNPSPPNPPDGRIHHAISYDSAQNKMILYGGNVAGNVNDTWEYDFATNTWTELQTNGNPGAINYHVMVYDISADKSILFSGLDDDAFPRAETWAFDYDTKTWTRMNPSESPTGRRDPGMVYDSTNEQMILFGGQALRETGGFWASNETWTYKYSTDTWTKMDPATAPVGRQAQAMSYDPVQDKVIMNMGTDSSRDLFFDGFWEYSYSNNEWKLLEIIGTPPYLGPHMVYDPFNDLQIVYGGPQTWTFNYNTAKWTLLYDENPPLVNGHKTIFNTLSNNVVIWSGFGPSEGRSSDLWSLTLYDGTVADQPSYTYPTLTNSLTSSTSTETEGNESSESGLELSSVAIVAILVLVPLTFLWVRRRN